MTRGKKNNNEITTNIENDKIVPIKKNGINEINETMLNILNNVLKEKFASNDNHNLATKDDLKSEIKELKTELKGDIKDSEERTNKKFDEVKDEIKGLRTELKGDLKELRTELKGDIKDSEERTNKRIDGLTSYIKWGSIGIVTLMLGGFGTMINMLFNVLSIISK